MKREQRLWTREELILTINLYCKLPFGRLQRLNPKVVYLSELIKSTPKECARLQSFPDDFEIPVSDNQAYRQFGNSVVMPMNAVAKQIVKVFNEFDESNES